MKTDKTFYIESYDAQYDDKCDTLGCSCNVIKPIIRYNLIQVTRRELFGYKWLSSRIVLTGLNFDQMVDLCSAVTDWSRDELI